MMSDMSIALALASHTSDTHAMFRQYLYTPWHFYVHVQVDAHTSIMFSTPSSRIRYVKQRYAQAMEIARDSTVH